MNYLYKISRKQKKSIFLRLIPLACMLLISMNVRPQLPNAVISDTDKIRFHFNNVTNILAINDVYVSNEGEAPFGNNLMVSVYKDEVKQESLMLVYADPRTIPPGNTIRVNVDIPFFDYWLPLEKLIIRINDAGDGTNDQPVSDDCCVEFSSEVFAGLQMDKIAWADSYRKCEGEDVTFLTSDLLEGGNFRWYHPDGSPESTQPEPTKTNLRTADLGKYVLEVSGVKIHLSIRYTLPHLSVAPPVLYWRQDAEDSNWNNVNNWSSTPDAMGNIRAVPAPCTTVHLPGNVAFFPSLDETSTSSDLYGEPEVDKVVFHFGSNLAHPHRLKYNKAFVQYNAGNYTTGNSDGWMSSILSRDRWYMLAAPLKKMASGDFSFGGYPYTWQSLYNNYIPGTGTLITGDFTTTFPHEGIEFSDTYNAFAFKVAPDVGGTGYTDQRYLESLGGIIEIPYFENEQINRYRPMHSYDTFTGESTFYSFNASTLQPVYNQFSKIKRGDEAYRFIYEDESGNTPGILVKGETVPCYKMHVTAHTSSRKVMIGNPFMAAINSENFYEANSYVLNQSEGFQIFDGTTGIWEPYTFSSTHHIAPLQSFVVTLTADDATLYFPLEGTYALTGPGISAQLRSSATGGAMQVFVRNDAGEGGHFAELRTQNRTKEDVSAAEDEELTTGNIHRIPQVFFIHPEENIYSLVQTYKESGYEIGVGVRCSDTDNTLTMAFLNTGEFVQLTGTVPVLKDKLLNTEQNLVENPVYQFRHQASEANNFTDDSRFVIQFRNSTEISGSEATEVSYCQNNLIVKTAEGIKNIQVYNLFGQLVYINNSFGEDTRYFNEDINLSEGCYIVQVNTVNGKKTSHKIIVH